ncbi:protein involved in gliding motility GldN [Mesonia phycicola]|uniref:Protein involved in gliding motility GldN n=1 Tax=Mesonia phycicola TaxID=579105 RepID=A0A1M6EYI5_9FLAO|nr:gliding motility protein GldN [Mesonia phycicola]SHI90485.1 protein involved in gliding motility GldN [Mesonia phycicola]
MKKSCFLAFVLFSAISSYAQLNVLNATKPEEIGKKSAAVIEADNADKPLPYGYVGERDILWAKTTWEEIDLDQRVNFPLLYPLDEIGGHRRPLFNLLVEAVTEDSITAYRDSYFNQKMSVEDIKLNLEAKSMSEAGLAAENSGEVVEDWMYNTAEADANAVQAYRIRGYWYFDKRQGELKYRLLAIAPVVYSAQNLLQKQDNPDLDIEAVELFWVFYPEVREILHDNYVFNGKNSANPITFDHLLNSRRFDATIYKEDNVQGDREVDDYISDNSLMQLLESNRIKETIRNFESDMWNY